MDWSGVGYCDVLSAVWTLILTAPIHCKGFIDEQVMQCYISPNLFWWTLLLLGWPESEDILICGWIMPFRVWTLCFIRSVSVFELFWDSSFMLVLFCVRQAMVTGCDHLILLNRCFVHNRKTKSYRFGMRVSKFTFHFCLNNCFYSRFKWFLDLKDFSLFTKFCTSMPLCKSNEHVNFYMLWDVIGHFGIVIYCELCQVLFPFLFHSWKCQASDG